MTGITLLTSWIFHDPSLSRELLRKQRKNLYWMASLFFLLFYTFPAGMVLYWTTNNVLALIVTLERKVRGKVL
jgi:membrane protein insertase Oxa1/YidC/SpoIIIJ